MDRRRILCGFLVLLTLAGRAEAATWSGPDIERLSDDAWGRAVRRGRDLVVATPALIGPEVADPGRRYAGNNLACQSCHLRAGTAAFGLPLIGVFADFPQYRAREGGVRPIEERINGCMRRSLNGRALPPDGEEMRALVAYMEFLSIGMPLGGGEGRGAAALAPLHRAADPQRGAAIYQRVCAACHGVAGGGQRVGVAGDAKGYLVPPLWGADSFNDGAGMARLISAARFIRSNMPAGTTWQTPVLGEEEAWDVAAFIESQDRPHMAGLAADFPNRLEKPADVAYGPFADGFGAEQHRFGPFQPIEDALRSLRARPEQK